jgi:hypothetical protein
MKHIFLRISVIILFCSFLSTGCKKHEELPPYHAKGTIISVTGGCYGEVVLIEVENPPRIGLSGTFSFIGNTDKGVTYHNAIGVPYFSKSGIPDAVPQKVGTRLYFEYRNITEEERGQSTLFSPDPPIVCLAIYGPPSANYYIIKNIISFK